MRFKTYLHIPDSIHKYTININTQTFIFVGKWRKI